MVYLPNSAQLVYAVAYNPTASYNHKMSTYINREQFFFSGQVDGSANFDVAEVRMSICASELSGALDGGSGHLSDLFAALAIGPVDWLGSEKS